MQKILLFNDAFQVSGQMSPKFNSLFTGSQFESFIGVDDFDVIAFDWYDVSGTKTTSRIAVYLDEDDLFFFCENDSTLKTVKTIIDEEIKDELIDNEQLLYHFFIRLMKNDTDLLNEFEMKITETEDKLVSFGISSLDEITGYRKELLRLKRYYEQLSMTFDELIANDNNLLSEKGVRYCTIVGNRTDRLFSFTVNLRDYIAQVLDVYQSQLDYRQNKLMKVFTVVTTIFLPLTLLVGWYGMNFDMPEFHWSFSYPVVIVFSVAVVIVLLSVFKHKKWI